MIKRGKHRKYLEDFLYIMDNVDDIYENASGKTIYKGSLAWEILRHIHELDLWYEDEYAKSFVKSIKGMRWCIGDV